MFGKKKNTTGISDGRAVAMRKAMEKGQKKAREEIEDIIDEKIKMPKYDLENLENQISSIKESIVNHTALILKSKNVPIEYLVFNSKMFQDKVIEGKKTYMQKEHGCREWYEEDLKKEIARREWHEFYEGFEGTIGKDQREQTFGYTIVGGLKFLNDIEGSFEIHVGGEVKMKFYRKKQDKFIVFPPIILMPYHNFYVCGQKKPKKPHLKYQAVGTTLFCY